MSTALSFWRAIQDDPDDLAHRLVYADWLAEQGDEARAEFVRIQCDLARLDEGWDPHYAILAAREDRLLNQHEDAWTAANQKTFGKHAYRTHCGGVPQFVEVLNLARLIKYADKALAPPVISVEVVLDDAKGADLLSLPQLDGLRELDIDRLVPATLKALCAAPLPNLRKLTLRSPACDREQLTTLFASPLMDRLTELELEDCDDHAAGLFARGRPANLRRLSLAYTTLTQACMRSLASPRWAGLTELHMDEVEAGPDDWAAVLTSPHWGALESLWLESVVEAPAVIGLIHNQALTNLHTLCVRHSDFIDPGRFVEALRRLDLPSLRRLDLEGNVLPAATGAALAGCPAAPRLTGLKLNGTSLKKSGTFALARGDFHSLRWLGLGDTSMGNNGLGALLAAPWLHGVEYLELSDNKLQSPAGKMIADAYTLGAVRVLLLDSNPDLGDRGLVPLVTSALPALRALQSLHLSDTNAGDKTLRALASSPLAANLVELMLDANDVLSEDDPLVLAGKCPNLQAIWWDVDGVEDDPEMQQRINEALGEGVFDFHRHYED